MQSEGGSLLISGDGKEYQMSAGYLGDSDASTRVDITRVVA